MLGTKWDSLTCIPGVSGWSQWNGSSSSCCGSRPSSGRVKLTRLFKSYRGSCIDQDSHRS